MKWVSLVPSWTETWIHLGLDVVGRTRYCIHPKKQVENIAVVGGTKDLNASKLKKLRADILLVDKEENRKEMVEKTSLPLFATHISDLKAVPASLEWLKQEHGHKLSQESLIKMEKFNSSWEKVLSHTFNKSIKDFPDVLEWIHPPDSEIDHILYIIWKNPMMTVGPKTYIGDTLSHLGYRKYLFDFDENYPKFEFSQIPPKTLLLFSSEPYDFGKKEEMEWIKSLKRPAALVEGESFSWFGIRSLRFLKSLMS